MYNYYVVVWSKGTKVSLNRIVGYTAAQDKNIISQYQNQLNKLGDDVGGKIKIGCVSRARIFKLFMEPMNRFQGINSGSIYVDRARICRPLRGPGIDSKPGGIDSWAP
jgi:hypothetical protein